MLHEVVIYTDGSCLGNPGKGGYCAILQSGDREKIVSGHTQYTTNNRMELTAAIEGLKALKVPCSVELISDSKYLCDAVNKHWIDAWKKQGWIKKDGGSVINPDLWKELDALLHVHKVKFTWVKGHAGNVNNERCDKIAVKESLHRYDQ